jgi:hypothetical protein
MTATTRRLAGSVALLAAFAAPAWARSRTVKVKLGPFPIEAKRDREMCQAFRIRGVAGMEIVSWEARSRVSQGQSVGSHHLVLYGYQGRDASAFPASAEDNSAGCAGFGPSDFFTGRVFLAGSGGERTCGKNWTCSEASMPGDLAQVIPGSADAPNDAFVVINSHYFNGAPKRGRGLVKVRLKLAPLAPGKRIVRQVIHDGASRDIKVAPGAIGPRVASSWQADGAPNDATEGGANPTGDVCIMTLSTHMHKRGTLFEIDYEQDGVTEEMLRWNDYIHAGTILWPALGRDPDVFKRPRALLRAYTAENGWPRFRYACTHANGADGREPKMGCEAEPGITPGLSWTEGLTRGLSPLETHAEPCGKDGVNCGGRACVPANLVFGPLSDDDMCILVALVYDPIPGAPPERACEITYQ